MKIYDLPDEEFNIRLLKKLSEIQENIDKHTKLGKQCLNKMLMKFNKEIETIRNRNPRAEQNNDRTEQFNKELQQQT